MVSPLMTLPGTILVFGQERNISNSIKEYLEKLGYHSEFSESINTTIEYIDNNRVDILLVDMDLAQQEKNELFTVLLQDHEDMDVIMLSRNELMSDTIDYLKKGAIDYILKPVNFEHLEIVLAKTIERRKLIKAAKERDKFRLLSLKDPLTGLYNSRYFYEKLEKEMEYSRRKKSILALLMVDIDNFKSINDNYGHQNGDKVIISIAEIIKKACRSYDTVSRYSGEEFCIILPDNSIKTSHTIANRILKSIAARKFDFCDRKITASIGISLFPEHTEKKDDLIGMADIALYVSKIAGKNMYTFYSSEMDTGFLQYQAEKHNARRRRHREDTAETGMGWIEI